MVNETQMIAKMIEELPSIDCTGGIGRGDMDFFVSMEPYKRVIRGLGSHPCSICKTEVPDGSIEIVNPLRGSVEIYNTNVHEMLEHGQGVKHALFEKLKDVLSQERGMTIPARSS